MRYVHRVFTVALLLAALFAAGLILHAPRALAQDADAATADAATADTPAVDDAVPDAVPDATLARTRGPVVHLTLDAVIHPIAAEYIREGIESADAQGASLVVLELDTPGGLLTSTRDIVQTILGARTPVAVHVGPRGAQAASAGFFLLLAGDFASMAPGTNTGAAHPVAGGGNDIDGDLGEKVEQDTAALIRSLAERGGRDIALAESAVLESKSFTADEALDAGLIDVLADDVPSLLSALDGRTVDKNGQTLVLATAMAPIDARPMSRIQELLSAIAHPNIAALLMALGMLGLYVELSNPGTLVPGVVGAICLVLAFFAASVLPMNHAGIALIVLGIAMFVAEIYVPTFGILTAGGAVSLILGGLMLWRDAPEALRLDPWLLIGLVASMVAVMTLLLGESMRMRRAPVVTGAEGMPGMRGVARTALTTDGGRVFLHGELWRAVADRPVAAGDAIEVTEVDGLTLRVRAVDADPSST
ncbi:MAG: nodulation protein NfeD [Acidobacteriota bacterium]